MRIMIVSPQLPFPLIDGAKKGVFYPIKYLAARGHSIHLACLAELGDPAAVKEMERYCTIDVVANSKTPTVKGALRSLFSSTPYDLSRFHNRQLLATIMRKLEAERFDVLQVEGIHAAFYGLEVKKVHDIPLVMRVHNVQSVNLQRSVGQFRNPLINAYLSYETGKVRRYETRESIKFDNNLTVSAHDATLVLAQNPSTRCTVVPAGVDINEFSVVGGPQDRDSVLWMGALQWIPNQDSAWWFIQDIVPRIVAKIPTVSARIAGSKPPKKILDVRHPNIQVLGFVDDIQATMRQAQVCVVPLRVGSGIRLKLLEMFALQKPVVSTSIGCEGLNVKNEEHLLIADDAESFAGAVARLLSDPSLRERLGRNAMNHAREHFSWEVIAGQYEAAYQAVLRKPRDDKPVVVT